MTALEPDEIQPEIEGLDSNKLGRCRRSARSSVVTVHENQGCGLENCELCKEIENVPKDWALDWIMSLKDREESLQSTDNCHQTFLSWVASDTFNDVELVRNKLGLLQTKTVK